MDRRYNRPSRNRSFSYSDETPPPPAYDSTSSRARTPSPPTEPSTMASWLNNSKAQFAATALISGAIVAGGILGYQHVRRQEKIEDLKSSIPRLGKEHQANKVRVLLPLGKMDVQLWMDKLTDKVKLTEFGAAVNDSGIGLLSKEDHKAVELAERAQRGDYDDGKIERLYGEAC
jgi:hypothetical protein